jgi:hypothetical protein
MLLKSIEQTRYFVLHEGASGGVELPFRLKKRRWFISNTIDNYSKTEVYPTAEYYCLCVLLFRGKGFAVRHESKTRIISVKIPKTTGDVTGGGTIEFRSSEIDGRTLIGIGPGFRCAARIEQLMVFTVAQSGI